MAKTNSIKMAKTNSIKKKLIVFVLLCLFTMNIQAKLPEWYVKSQQIKIFQSTKQDVERIFNSAKVYSEREYSWLQVFFYKTSEGTLWASYSSGKCLGKNNEGYNVERDVLIDFRFSPKNPVKLSKSQISLQGLEGEKESDTGNVFYRNKELGVEYTILYILGKPFTEKNGKFAGIVLFPTTKQDKEFLCSNSNK